MAQKRRKKKKKETQPAGPETRAAVTVAIHEEVRTDMQEWSRGRVHNAVSAKVTNLLRALVAMEQDTVNALLKALAVTPIAAGLVELGPKLSKGGAARVFLFRHKGTAVLVASAVEKGSGGVREIDTAKERAAELRQWLDLPPDQARAHIAAKYTIINPPNDP